MNLSPLPDPDDVIITTQVKVGVTAVDGQGDHPVEMFLAAFQGDDRPPLVAYGVTEKATVVALYNRLVDEVDGQDDGE